MSIFRFADDVVSLRVRSMLKKMSHRFGIRHTLRVPKRWLIAFATALLNFLEQTDAFLRRCERFAFAVEAGVLLGVLAAELVVRVP